MKTAEPDLIDRIADALPAEIRADFYREHRRPKKLWLKTLSRNTRVILRGMDLPAAYQAGCDLQTAERAFPFRTDRLATIPWRHGGNRAAYVCMARLSNAWRHIPSPPHKTNAWCSGHTMKARVQVAR